MMYLNALGALLALVWSWALTPDDPPADPPSADSEATPADEPKPEAKYTDKDLDKYKGDARKDGRTAGEKAAEKKWLDSLGVKSLEEAQQKFTAWKELEDDEKSELDKASECIDTITGERDTFKQRAETAEEELKSVRVTEALSEALAEQNLRPDRRKIALRSLDRSGVIFDDNGNLTGTKEAAEALAEEEPSWFVAEAARPRPTGSPETGRPNRTGADKPTDEAVNRQRRETVSTF